jgi:hypothetical protein
MPAIFSSCPGRVTAVSVPVDNCSVSLVSIEDDTGAPELTYERDAIILTRLNVTQSANMQFLHTLGNRVYVYAFGDRMGQIQLTGLAFAATSDHGASTSAGSSCAKAGLPYHSAKNVFTWYKINKASTRATPVIVTIFDLTFQGFVVALNTDVIDPASQLVQWTITLATLPD